jgi:transposase
MTPRQQLYADLVAKGMTLEQVAEATGVGVYSVQRGLQRAGIMQVRRAPPNKIKPDDSVLAPWREKLSNGEASRREMAAHFGVSIASVHRWALGVRMKVGRKVGSPGNRQTRRLAVSEQRSRALREREMRKRAELLGDTQAVSQ